MDIQNIEKKLEINEQKQFKGRVEALNYYTRQFMYHVPFENLDVQNGVRISTELNDLYDKLIKRNRGGYCYENNTFFGAYLEEKGFDTHFVGATIHTPNGGRSRFGTHMSLIVEIEGESYVADVGFGDLPADALHVTHDGSDIVEDIGGTYRAVYIDDTIHVQKWVDEEWQTKYEAEPQARDLDYFSDNIEYNQTNPNSVFVKRLIVTMPKPYGRATMSHENLTISKEGKKEKHDVTSENYKAILKKYFGLDVTVSRLEQDTEE